MANIKEVAELAGVGYGTVSRYINKSGYVSQESGRKIQAAIDTLDFKPNELARNFLRNHSKIIGVMLPDIEHPFFSEFLQNVERQLYTSEYKVIVCSADQTHTKQTQFLDLLDKHLLDGIITGIDRWDDPRLNNFSKPVVSLDRNWGNTVPIVHSDHIKSGNLLAEHIVRSGCHNLIHFSAVGHNSEPFAIRDMILHDSLRKAKVHIQHIEISWDVMDFNYCNKIVKEHLSKFSECDSIYAGDLLALSCLNTAHEQGISVPDQLKIIATDGINISRLAFPVLTCIRQDIPTLASVCTRTLLDMIEKKREVPHEQIVDVSFQTGGTM